MAEWMGLVYEESVAEDCVGVRDCDEAHVCIACRAMDWPEHPPHCHRIIEGGPRLTERIPQLALCDGLLADLLPL